jgi:protein TonB
VLRIFISSVIIASLGHTAAIWGMGKIPKPKPDPPKEKHVVKITRLDPPPPPVVIVPPPPIYMPPPPPPPPVPVPAKKKAEPAPPKVPTRDIAKREQQMRILKVLSSDGGQLARIDVLKGGGSIGDLDVGVGSSLSAVHGDALGGLAVPSAGGGPPLAGLGTAKHVMAHARYGENPSPEYPLEARRHHQEGTVMVSVTVDPNGRPSAVELSRTSGFPALDEAALSAVHTWHFEPATDGGVPVVGKVVVPVRFVLGN